MAEQEIIISGHTVRVEPNGSVLHNGRVLGRVWNERTAQGEVYWRGQPADAEAPLRRPVGFRQQAIMQVLFESGLIDESFIF